jgi:hypothetical protein
MAHYFFPANYRGISVNDDVGEEFSTLQDAEAHERKVCRIIRLSMISNPFEYA